ncbi:MAG: hypothetical protein EP297_01300 [Gammaproteobacteria bacterium]|nr:MAG: hypothetical protein EP297_01300 [Gammaproteobacteria bacterium]
MDKILQHLQGQPQSTIITSTHRLSRTLLHRYNRLQIDEGLKSWDTPDILPWQSWLQRLWNQSLVSQNSPARLLNTWQSRLLWEGIIERHSDELLNLSSTAEKARQCRELLLAWQVDLTNDQVRQSFLSVSDSRAWFRWHEAYQSRLHVNQWTDAEGLPSELLRVITRDDIAIGNDIIFTGFDELTPVQQSIIEAISRKDIEVVQLKEDVVAVEAALYTARDEQAELYMAARWARKRYESDWNSDDDPIGIVVPSITRQRSDIERIFREVFYPQDNLQTVTAGLYHGQGVRRESVFNLSLGVPLLQQPLIRYLFDILTICNGTFDQACLSRVITSHFFTSGETQMALRYSQLDIFLRSLCKIEWTLESLMRQSRIREADELTDIFTSLSQLLSNSPDKALHTDWVRLINKLLKTTGWPDEKAFESHEIQIMQAWDDVLTSFAQLQDVAGKKISFNQMQSRLRQIAGSKVFQAGAADVPIQIMGMIEASGMSFSALRICGMQDRDWPPPPSPNPFIPAWLQIEFDMPHSSSKREYEYAQWQFQHLLASSKNISISFAASSEDETYNPSPLVAHFPLQAAEQPVKQEPVWPVYDYFSDTQGTPLNESENHVSTFVLRDQSQCPFRAYVKHRLLASAPETSEPGIDPRTRGILLHEVMEHLWRQWEDQQTLLSLPDEIIDETVQTVIQKVLDKRFSSSNRVTDLLTSGSSVAELENYRLQGLVSDWLSIERQRQPFRVINPESKQYYDLGGLHLSMRIDRVDELADGSLCIIDYKTGQASPASWCGERLEEPQLPLYCLVQQQPVSAVAFAKLRAGETTLAGITSDHQLLSDNDRVLGDIKQLPMKRKNSACAEYTDWMSLLDHWRQILSSIASEYVTGNAQVDPINPVTTCRYCDIHPVCRIFESDAVVQENDS